MAASATVTVSGTVQSGPAGSTLSIGPFSITSANAAFAITSVVLDGGDNTITVPATPTPTGCLIIPPSTNTAAITYKGAGGDTGTRISKTQPQMLTFDSASVPANFVLNSATTQTAVSDIMFF